MIKKSFLIFVLIVTLAGISQAQAFIRTTDLFSRADKNAGKLEIIQDAAVDTLISRYIMMSSRFSQENDGNFGMSGYRIQIYNSSNRNAKLESKNVRLEFMDKFPNIPSYQKFSEPGYFKVRVGDFRTRDEATKTFLMVSRVFPNSYIVPDVINFPELSKN